MDYRKKILVENLLDNYKDEYLSRFNTIKIKTNEALKKFNKATKEINDKLSSTKDSLDEIKEKVALRADDQSIINVLMGVFSLGYLS